MHSLQNYGLRGIDDVDYILTDNGSPMIKAFCQVTDEISAGDEELSEMDEGELVMPLILYYYHRIIA